MSLSSTISLCTCKDRDNEDLDKEIRLLKVMDQIRHEKWIWKNIIYMPDGVKFR